jgi:hypothetical protein
VAMLVDHIGLWLFPDVTALRIIGRISFPLFAWLIANGAYHTQDIKKYIIRLGIFALISQIPFYLLQTTLTNSSVSLNIFFSLTLSLITIFCIQKTNSKWVGLGAIFISAVVAEFLRMEYGATGILSVVFFYIFFNQFAKMVFSQLLLFLSFYLYPVLEKLFQNILLQREDIWSLTQIFSLFSLILIRFYNEKLGVKAQYLFYIFYPAHLVILYIVKVIADK